MLAVGSNTECVGLRPQRLCCAHWAGDSGLPAYLGSSFACVGIDELVSQARYVRPRNSDTSNLQGFENVRINK